MTEWFRAKIFLVVVGLFFVLAQVCLAQEKEKDVKKESDKIFELGQIVVTALKTEKILSDVPVETRLITKKEIENSNAQTIADLLKYTPGIGTGFAAADDRPGKLDWRANFRGLGLNEGRGLILVDSQRIKGGGMGEAGYGIDQIPTEMIERIEVVKGPASVLYGSDAMAGVINIITKPAAEKRFFSCQMSYATNDDSNVALSIGNKIDKLGYVLNYTREESTAHRYRGIDEKDDYEGNFVNTKVNLEIDKGKNLNLGISWDKKSWMYADWESMRISPGLEVKFDDGSKFSLKGYWYDWNFHHFAPGFARNEGDLGYRQVESQYSRLLFDKHMVTVGVEFLQEKIASILIDYRTIETSSIFLQDEWQALNNLNLVFGARFDSHSEFGQEFNPRLSGLLEITDKTRLRGCVGQSFKSPTIRELYYRDLFRHGRTKDYPFGFYIESNPNLKPEYGIGYSVGLEHEFRDKLLFNVSVFRNDVKDMVLSYDTGRTVKERGREIPIRSFKNIGKGCTQGVELELKARITKTLASFLSYTFLDTEDKDTKKELIYRPKHTAGWRLNYDNEKYGFGANFGVRYVDSMFKDLANLQKTDDYFVAEIKFSKEITKYAKASLEIDNLFKTDYGDPTIKREGRTFTGKVNLKF